MKKLVLCSLLGVFSVSAFALSWGGILNNNSKLSANNDFSRLSLNQSNGVSFFVKSPLNSNENLKFSGEVLYKYNLDYDFDSKESTFTNILDCDLLKISGKWAFEKGTFSLDAGRFKFGDFSGTVFTQTSDGVAVSYDDIKIKAGFYAGYTGLLNRLNVSMTDNEYEAGQQFYKLCPQYIPLVANVAYKALFDSHTIALQGECFIPLKNELKTKAYATAMLNGSVGSSASYNLKATFGTQKFENLMLDTKATLNLFVIENSIISLSGEYVSGNQGLFDTFETITTRSYGNAPVSGGVILPQAAFVYAKNSFVASLSETCVIEFPSEKAELNGFDTSVNLVYNVLSDVQLGFDLGAYLCTKEKTGSNYYAAFKASLAF